MVLWVISIGRTGGKVCLYAESVQLALGSMQWSPGRLTDERSEGCNSSCSPPCLATHCHAKMKCQLISSVVNCCDSSFVNVWTWLFRHHHLTSLWLFSFTLRVSFFFKLYNFPQSHTAEHILCTPLLCPQAAWDIAGHPHFSLFPYQFNFEIIIAEINQLHLHLLCDFSPDAFSLKRTKKSKTHCSDHS